MNPQLSYYRHYLVPDDKIIARFPTSLALATRSNLALCVACAWEKNACVTYTLYIQLFQLRLSMSKAEKSNTSAKGCRELLWKFINLLAIPSSLSRSYSTFPLCSWTTLIEIAVYILSEFSNVAQYTKYSGFLYTYSYRYHTHWRTVYWVEYIRYILQYRD
jgi:hypothetical protein